MESVRLEVNEKAVIVVELDLKKLKKSIKTEPLYPSIRNAMTIKENKVNFDKDKIIDVIYPELDWATIFVLMEKKSDNLELRLFNVKVSNMPTLVKEEANYSINAPSTFTFKVDMRSYTDWMVIGQGVLSDMDAYLDKFFAGRYYDFLAKDWDKDVRNI